jgi:hypothetical protein
MRARRADARQSFHRACVHSTSVATQRIEAYVVSSPLLLRPRCRQTRPAHRAAGYDPQDSPDWPAGGSDLWGTLPKPKGIDPCPWLQLRGNSLRFVRLMVAASFSRLPTGNRNRSRHRPERDGRSTSTAALRSSGCPGSRTPSIPFQKPPYQTRPFASVLMNLMLLFLVGRAYSTNSSAFGSNRVRLFPTVSANHI